MKIKRDIEKRYAEILSGINIIDNNKESFPEGSLSIKGKKENEWFHQYTDLSGAHKSEYIKTDDKKFATKLAMKGYYQKLNSLLQSEKKAMERFLKDYHPEKKYELYDNMKDSRKALVEPMFKSIEDQVEEWRHETYDPNPSHPEHLIHESARGELMRSKSEVIIAGLIDEEPELEYRYEKPLFLVNGGSVLYPDFTIINNKTARIYYLEHIGLLLNKEYAESFIWKMNTYAKNGICQGKELLLTFEKPEGGVDIRATRKTIKTIVKNCSK